MIGILNAYHFEKDSDYQKEYSQLFLDFVARIFPERKSEIKEYKVALNEFPNSVDECDIWFITGSPKSVYDDIPWVHRLAEFTRELDKNKKKLIGICFGHQMVAHALGGKVTKSPKGWGVGIRSFPLDDHSKNISLLFSHQDQVDTLPPTAKHLAGDEFCPNQMSQIGNHILTLQGHPEFSVSFARDRLISRRDKMPAETFEAAMKSYGDRNDHTVLETWIRDFAQKS